MDNEVERQWKRIETQLRFMRDLAMAACDTSRLYRDVHSVQEQAKRIERESVKLLELTKGL